MKPCEVCGAPAGTGGDRYANRPAKYCSPRCRSMGRRGKPDRLREIERLRALLDAGNIDWREGALSDAPSDD